MTERAKMLREQLFQYAANHKEVSELVEVLKNLLPDNKTRNNCELNIAVGNSTDVIKGGFQSFLNVRTHEPFIVVSEWNGEPVIQLRDKALYNIASINLALVHDIQIEAQGQDDEYCGFIRYNIIFGYINGLEYAFTLIVNKIGA